jgi:hypothetical protein
VRTKKKRTPGGSHGLSGWTLEIIVQSLTLVIVFRLKSEILMHDGNHGGLEESATLHIAVLTIMPWIFELHESIT